MTSEHERLVLAVKKASDGLEIYNALAALMAYYKAHPDEIPETERRPDELA